MSKLKYDYNIEKNILIYVGKTYIKHTFENLFPYSENMFY